MLVSIRTSPIMPSSMSRSFLRKAATPLSNAQYRCALSLLDAQHLEAGDDVEQLLVDAALAQTVECAMKGLQFLEQSVQGRMCARLVSNHMVS